MLSVIVPLYQNAATIRRCITSIGDGCEIVVVDDGSTDEGAAVAASFPYVRLLHQEHQGAAAARNKGIEAATGEYLWFVDADDVLLPGAISAAEEVLREHKPDLFKMGRLVDATRSQEALDVPCPALTRQVPLADIYGQDKGTLDHTTFLFSRQYLLSHGLRYPEGMTILEESLFVLRCLATHPVVCHNATYRFYHIHTRHATQGRWESVRRQAFLPDIATFFQAFHQYALTHIHARALYDRYLYVYLRVLLVKFCTWRELMLFRQQAGPYLGHASLQRRLMRCRLSYAILFVARRMLFFK